MGMTFKIALKRYTFHGLFRAFILAVHTEGRMSTLLRQPGNDTHDTGGCSFVAFSNFKCVSFVLCYAISYK